MNCWSPSLTALAASCDQINFTIRLTEVQCTISKELRIKRENGIQVEVLVESYKIYFCLKGGGLVEALAFC